MILLRWISDAKARRRGEENLIHWNNGTKNFRWWLSKVALCVYPTDKQRVIVKEPLCCPHDYFRAAVRAYMVLLGRLVLLVAGVDGDGLRPLDPDQERVHLVIAW